MMGFPGFAGFVAKEAALYALVGGSVLDTITLIAIAIGSAFTAAYTLRFWWGAFASKEGIAGVKIKKRSWIMTVPVVALSLGGLIFGVGAHWLDAVLAPHAQQLAGEPGHLAAWPGLGVPFFLTVLIIVAGVAIFAARGPFERVFGKRDFPISADGTYQLTLDGLDAVRACDGVDPAWFTARLSVDDLYVQRGFCWLRLLVGNVSNTVSCEHTIRWLSSLLWVSDGSALLAAHAATPQAVL